MPQPQQTISPLPPPPAPRFQSPSRAATNGGYGTMMEQNDPGEQQQQQQETSNSATQEEQEQEQDDHLRRGRDRPATPLPKMQIAILCIMRMSEPISFLCILPFVPRMVRENLQNVPENQVGYYVGFIESVFALVQFSTVFFWGSTSDRIGRKPVLLIGLMGTFLSINCFGLSQTFPQMILSRSLNGLMNANIGVLKSSLGEFTDETNQARAFTMVPLAFSIGSMIGPTIGGKLSNPAEGFPDIFGDSEFLKKYPYWLPCFVCSLFNVIGFIVGFFFLKETLSSKVRQEAARKAKMERNEREEEEEESLLGAAGNQERGHEREEAGGGEEGEREGEEAEATTPKPTLRELLTPDVVAALINSGLMNFVNICYTAVLPLFLYTTIARGGISFTKEQVGYYLAANGLVVILVQLFIFPPMEKAMGGPLATLRRACSALPLTFLCFPIAHFVVKDYGFIPSLGVFGILLLLRGLSSIMIVSSNLCINNVAPSRSALGKLNGLQQMLGCLSRGVAPIFSTSLFAFSITHTYDFFDGQLVWLIFSLISLITYYSSSKMRNANEIQWRRK